MTEISRETIVYHGVSAETPLLPVNQPSRRVYSAITLADIFQKVVYTTFLTSLLLFARGYLLVNDRDALKVYYAFAITSHAFASLVNLFSENLMETRTAVQCGFVCYFLGVSSLAVTLLYLHRVEYVAVLPFLLICFGESVCKTLIGSFCQEQRTLFPQATVMNRIYWIAHGCAIFIIAFLIAILQFAGFFIGLILCCFCLLAGFMSFFIGWSKFEVIPRNNVRNSLLVLFSIIKEARSNKVNFCRTSSQSIVRVHWLDFASIQFGGSYSEEAVQEAKSFFKMLALFIAFVPYWFCNAQGYSTFILQAFHLNTSIGNHSLAVSWIALVNIIAVVLLVQLLEKVVYPCFRRNGWSFPYKWRVMAGMIAASLSMLLAGSVQLKATRIASANGVSSHVVGKFSTTYVSSVHIVYAIPQFLFIGMSEILVGLTGLCLACKQCPGQLQKLITSVYSLTIACGHLLSLLLLYAGWMPADSFISSYGPVVYFYTAAAGPIVGMLLFLAVLSYQYDAPDMPRAETSLMTQESVL